MPNVPPQALQYQHPSGERHIKSVDATTGNATMVDCPGQENEVRVLPPTLPPSPAPNFLARPRADGVDRACRTARTGTRSSTCRSRTTSGRTLRASRSAARRAPRLRREPRQWHGMVTPRACATLGGRRDDNSMASDCAISMGWVIYLGGIGRASGRRFWGRRRICACVYSDYHLPKSNVGMGTLGLDSRRSGVMGGQSTVH